MEEVVLVRYGEIGLKGKNRPAFENRLVESVRRALDGDGQASVRREYGRIVVDFKGNPIPEWAIDRLQSVFGVVSVSPAKAVEPSLDAALAAARRIVEEEIANRQAPVYFKVETSRSNKRFPMTSPEINGWMGGRILRAFPALKVDVHNPDFVLNLEVRDKAIYLYTRRYDGPGGLPVGSSGKGLLLLSGGIDSPVAGWLAMKRGIQVQAIHFHSFPFTSDRSKRKVIDLARVLSRYAGRTVPLHVINFTPAQTQIRQNVPEAMVITIMRRMMLRIATQLAQRLEIPALITGESVGQVASQTLESLAAINEVTSMPIIRPLVTMDKEEIVTLAERIGTYEISILPYEDCCTLFVPRHPETKPRLERVRRVEEPLPVDELVHEAVETAETIEADSLARV